MAKRGSLPDSIIVNNNILHDEQHDFHKSVLCDSHVIVTINNLVKGLNTVQQIGRTYTYLSQLNITEMFTCSRHSNPEPETLIDVRK